MTELQKVITPVSGYDFDDFLSALAPIVIEVIEVIKIIKLIKVITIAICISHARLFVRSHPL